MWQTEKNKTKQQKVVQVNSMRANGLAAAVASTSQPSHWLLYMANNSGLTHGQHLLRLLVVLLLLLLLYLLHLLLLLVARVFGVCNRKLASLALICKLCQINAWLIALLPNVVIKIAGQQKERAMGISMQLSLGDSGRNCWPYKRTEKKGQRSVLNKTIYQVWPKRPVTVRRQQQLQLLRQ